MRFLNFSQKTHFLSYKNFPRAKKVERVRMRGPYAWTKFQANRWKIQIFLAKKPSSSWAPMEADIYAYRWKNTKNGVGDIHSSTHESKGVIIFNITKRSVLYRKYEAYINLEVKSPKHPKIGSHTHFPA